MIALRAAQVPQVALLAALLVPLLTGCGDGDDRPDPEASAERTGSTQEPSPSSEPASEPPTEEATVPDSEAGDTGCLVGRWFLDVADYQGQADAYLKSVGIPIESLEITGEQILDINESPYLSVSTDLVVNASVQGLTFGYRDQSAGGGEWGFDSPDAIVVDGFAYTVEPEVPPGGAPAIPFLDPSAGPLSVSCDGDRLSLRGATAPLTGNFVRR